MTEPLYVVDGLVLNGSPGDIEDLDIERLEVLRGERATAAYGPRGADGVVRITTRSGPAPDRA